MHRGPYFKIKHTYTLDEVVCCQKLTNNVTLRELNNHNNNNNQNDRDLHSFGEKNFIDTSNL